MTPHPLRILRRRIELARRYGFCPRCGSSHTARRECLPERELDWTQTEEDRMGGFER